jgi:4-hydroxy-2-oxoheptanedioate aldolase
MALSRSNLDYILIDMEHGPLNVEELQVFLMGMTDKQAILRKGNLQPDVVPFVRIPQYGRESLMFIVKQVLDVGVFGIMFPHIDTADQARIAVQSSRYPQKSGAPDMEPLGLRGNSPGNAVWYWGLPGREYADRADAWPLDPHGELLLAFQIESMEAVNNIDSILAVPGVGVIFIGPNDLSYHLGNAGNADTPEEEAAIQKVLQACLKKNVRRDAEGRTRFHAEVAKSVTSRGRPGSVYRGNKKWPQSLPRRHEDTKTTEHRLRLAGLDHPFEASDLVGQHAVNTLADPIESARSVSSDLVCEVEHGRAI